MMNAEEVAIDSSSKTENFNTNSHDTKGTKNPTLLTSFNKEFLKSNHNPNVKQNLDRKEKFEIQVSDPVKMGEGMRAFISYKVVARILDSTGNTVLRTTSVIRRFSDFAWLPAHLRKAYPGYIVPPLPEKVYITF